MADEAVDTEKLKAQLKFEEDKTLKACQADLSALLDKYKVELAPSFLVQDGRILTQIGLRVKQAQ